MDIPVGEFEGEKLTMRTLVCGKKDSEKPRLVLLHGYAGSGPLFYKAIRKLISRFQLILVDLIGMGGSSRPKDFDVDKFNPYQALDYLVGYIEKWRQGMGNLTNFVLAGHSFGGYIVGNYATRYP